MRVVLGGTFSPLHDGPRALLHYAAEHAHELVVGITVNSLVENKAHPIESLEARVATVRNYVNSIAPHLEVTIAPLHTPYGSTLDEDYDLLVVSPETMAGALRINELRHLRGKTPLPIAEISWVLADDGSPISSSRIWAGEIDEHGHLLHREKYGARDAVAWD